MSKGQSMNRQKDIARVLREQQMRIKGGPKTGFIPRQSFRSIPRSGK